MQDEQRAEQRVSFFLLDHGKQPIWSFATRAGTTAGIILDMSPFGGRLLIPGDAHTDANIDEQNLLISINHVSTGEALTFEIEARVLWSKDRAATDYREIGCQFAPPDGALKLKIMQLIALSSRAGKPLIVRCELSSASAIKSREESSAT